ncbi:apolipoprotein N-acyltransferase [Nitrosomonas sp.]|uniref:apolipoprotein N-acyltransferase n=1 Tax=Nitrosomonas sp. TaxID=42353 RepID=UPI00260AA7AF|nr:apolipoprotein N-acyltransferase [Nitrosomonas sp.]MCW5600999.1 apolipoprotein N-acyltransferase [Nitrosomonas sp.]
MLGALTVLGFAPFYLFPIPFITLAALLFLWRNSIRAGQAAKLGFSFGMGMFGAGVTWIYVSLHDFGDMPMPMAVVALLLLCAYLSLFPALTGWLSIKWRAMAPALWPCWAASLWMFSEWGRGTLFTGFPWLAVGYSQAPYGMLTGFAPLVGVYGISWLLVLSAAWLCVWFERRKLKQAWQGLSLLGLLWALGLGLQWINWTQPEGDPITISLLQGNIPQDMKWREDHILTTMEIYAKLIQESDSQLIVTPEISIPLFHDDVPNDYLAGLAAHAIGNDGDVLIGMAESVSSSRQQYYNTMFSLGKSPEQRYRKHHLVPFGEYIPLKPVFGWIIQVLNIPLSDFSRGALDQPPLQLAGQRVAINICYEDVFGEEIILPLPEASLLVNVSNDAWFGRSIGPWQHLQISQMRALETGRYMLRATNTGVTAIIDQKGRVLQKLEMFTTDGLHGEAQGYQGATLYVFLGNALILGFAGLLLMVGMASVFYGKRKTL